MVSDNRQVRVDIVRQVDRAKIRIRTLQPFSQATLFSIKAELMAHAMRPRTTPQLNQWGGFCSHIRLGSASRTAKAVLKIADDAHRASLRQ